MDRKEIYNEIEEMFGLVPSFFKSVPDSSLELEWKLFKRVQFDEGPIPNKYRELNWMVSLPLNMNDKGGVCDERKG